MATLHPFATASAVELQRLRELMEAETGMDFAGNRLSRLEDALGKVLRRWKPLPGLGRLLSPGPEHGPFVEELSAELTVGETFFFRNEHHFRALREHVLPAILRENTPQREIRLWSAGCASGEEPYSLAILLDQVLQASPDAARAGAWRVAILGTDLNPEFLARGRAALYRPWSFRQTTIHQDRRYFLPEADAFRLAPEVRHWVRFAYLNLVKDVYPSPLTGTLGLDLILFRNVAIYLKPEVIRAVLARLHGALRPGGWLLVGETEVGAGTPNGFQVRRFEQATFYQKTDHAARPAADWSRAGLSPVLPTVPMDGVMKLPQVPTKPAWVPLPTREAIAPPPAPARREPETSRAEQAERLAAEGRYVEAERALDGLAAKSERARTRLRYVQILLTRAEGTRARQMLTTCLAEEPLLIEAQLLQASFAEEAGDLAAAEQAYRRALYIERQCPMAHFHLGLVLDQKGDRTGAERSFRTALRLLHGHDPQAPVEFGEGVCCGRLRDMIALLIREASSPAVR